MADHVTQLPTQVTFASKPMMGQIHPPEDQTLSVSEAQFERFIYALQVVQTQAIAPISSVAAVREAQAVIEETNRSLGAWLAPRLDKSVEEFFKTLGKGKGALVVAGMGAALFWAFELVQKLQPLITALKHWMTSLSP